MILAAPSKDGLEVVRSRVADLLAWEQVEAELKDQAKSGSVDAQRIQRLTVEMEKAKKLLPDAIRQAWCMMVTVSETNDVQAFKLGITDEALFMTLKADPRSRLQETKITAGVFASRWALRFVAGRRQAAAGKRLGRRVRANASPSKDAQCVGHRGHVGGRLRRG